MDAIFDADERLALFPASPPVPPHLFTLPDAGARRVEDANAAPRLDRTALLRGLGSPLLRVLVGLQLRLSPLYTGGVFAACMVTFGASWAIVTAYIPRSGIPLFGPTQFAVAVAFLAIYIAWHVWGAVSGLTGRGRYFRSKQYDFSGHPHAVLARWARLVNFSPDQNAAAEAVNVETGKAPEHPLVRHVDGDEACPCGKPACAGGLPRRSGLLRLLDVLARFALMGVHLLFGIYTQFITLRSFTWTTPVPATFASLLAVSFAIMLVFSSLLLVSASLPTLELSRRLHVRAVSDAVADMLRRHFAALWDADRDREAAEAALRITEPYQDLCDRLAAYRTNRFAVLGVSWALFVGFVVLPVAGAIANVVAGSCIPACWLTPLLYFLYFFARELLAVAAANAQVSGTSTVLRRASREATALLARATADGLSGTRAAKSLAWHAELLEKYAADQARAKVLGIEADWGSARAILIAVFTVAVGLWSVLRSSGVVLTLEIACPS
ncbi:hypothetical protein DFJ74DRAFT_475157 [Hyaloraphidium curvatum]|nr:hypothetical protein DFJ74DRAFT_475157 [Hyaloraphidium curvatum]